MPIRFNRPHFCSRLQPGSTDHHVMAVDHTPARVDQMPRNVRTGVCGERRRRHTSMVILELVVRPPCRRAVGVGGTLRKIRHVRNPGAAVPASVQPSSDSNGRWCRRFRWSWMCREVTWRRRCGTRRKPVFAGPRRWRATQWPARGSAHLQCPRISHVTWLWTTVRRNAITPARGFFQYQPGSGVLRYDHTGSGQHQYDHQYDPEPALFQCVWGPGLLQYYDYSESRLCHGSEKGWKKVWLNNKNFLLFI